MAKVLVFGAGGVGCIYAYLLEKGGAQVTAVCRTNYERVRDNGIVIRSKKWGTCVARPTAVRSCLDASEYGPFGYVLVASKAFPGTAELIRDAVTSDTAIVLAQNGIGIEEDYARAYPDNIIISGVVYLPTTQGTRSQDSTRPTLTNSNSLSRAWHSRARHTSRAFRNWHLPSPRLCQISDTSPQLLRPLHTRWRYLYPVS